MSNEFIPKQFSEFCKQPLIERDWIVEDFLIVGGTSLLAGKPKDGKSLFTRHLIKSIISGSPFLGRQVKHGYVCLLALEDIDSELRRELVQIGIDEQNERLLIQTAPITIKELNKINMYFSENFVDLLVIDTLARFTDIPDMDSYSLVTKALVQISNVARKRGTHILMLHHAKKGGEGTGHDAVLGSTALSGNVDVTILLKRKPDDSVELSTRPRYGSPLAITFKYQAESMELLSSSGTKKASIKDAVIKCFSDSEPPLTTDQITSGAGFRKSDVESVIRQLVDANEIKRTGKGQKGDPFKYSPPGP